MWKGSDLMFLGGWSKVSLRDQAVFMRQWQAMLQAGVPLLQSLEGLSRSLPAPFEEMLQDCCGRLQAGHRLSGAFAPYQDVFGEVFLAMLRVGEQTGTLLGQLDRYALLLERRWQFQRKLAEAATYPLFLGFCSLALSALFCLVLMPSVAPFLRSLPLDLPWPTRALLWFSDLARQPLCWVASLASLWLILWEVPQRLKDWRRQQDFCVSMDRALWRMPWSGKTYRCQQRALGLLTLATAVEVGLGVLRGLELAAQSSSNQFFGEELKGCAREIAEGERLVDSLRRREILPGWQASLVGIGEESGRLGDCLIQLARLSESEALQSVQLICALAEPFLLCCMALLAAFMAVATLAPISTVLSAL